MKKTSFFLLFVALFVAYTSNAQVITECTNPSNPSDRLWRDYSPSSSNPSALPAPIPSHTVNYTGLVKKSINANYAELEAAVIDLAQNNGGVITFKNVGAGKTIYFNNPIDVQRMDHLPCVTILIEGDNKVVFNGNNTSTCFVFRRHLKLIVQNATFTNCRFTKATAQTANFRTSGGAIEMHMRACLRVYNCKFLNNNIDEWHNTLSSGYNGVHENHNGAGIRLNNYTTTQVLKCTFENCKAVTGAAIGATSITKLTVMDCLFKNNTSTSYNTKGSDRRRRIPEGAGAIRVDRTAKPIEIYRTEFTGNKANLKTSCIEVFIRPLRDFNNGSSETGPYPSPSQNALLIKDCVFKNNDFYNFQGAVNPDRDAFFAGPILFHGGSVGGSFLGAKMKIENTVFDGNEVGNSTIQSFLNFEYKNCIFANSQFLHRQNSDGSYKFGIAAIGIRPETANGRIDNCTFYNNNPHPQADHRTNATDLFSWGPHTGIVVNNSIFYRTNTNTSWKQSRVTYAGTGNNQFIPNANMSQVASISNNAVNTTNPNIVPNSITDMCLGNNSLPQGIGGLSDCGSGGGNNNPPPPPSSFIVANGLYTINSKVSSNNLAIAGTGGVTVAAPSSSDQDQQWEIQRIGSTSTYTIRSKSNNRYLEVPYARCVANTGDAIGTWTAASSNHQKWLIEDAGNNEVIFRPVHCQGKALTSWATNPTTLYAYNTPTNPYADQHFTLQLVPTTAFSISDGLYVIKAKPSGDNVEIETGGTIRLKSPNASNQDQQWEVKKLANSNAYTIQSKSTNRYMEVPYARCTANGEDATGTWTQVLGNHQKWLLEDGGNGDVILRPLHCQNKALTSWSSINGVLRTAVTPASPYSDQRFKLEPVSATFSGADGIYTITTHQVTNRNLKVSTGYGITSASPNNSDQTQHWEIKKIPNTSFYSIQSQSNNNYLEVPYARCAATGGDPAGTWTQVIGNHQKWMIEDVGSGLSRLTPVHCQGKALTVWSNVNATIAITPKQVTNGTAIPAQSFYIRSASSNATSNASFRTASIETTATPAKTELSATVAPNPVTNGQLTLSLELPTTASTTTIVLYDVLGAVVFEQVYNELPEGSNSLEVDLNNNLTAKGVHFLSIQHGAASVVKRLIVTP